MNSRVNTLIVQPGLGEPAAALPYRLARPLWESRGIRVVEAPPVERWMDSVAALHALAEREPSFVLGVSLGAVLALDAAPPLRGLITVGAPLGQTGTPAWLMPVGRALARLVPEWRMPSLLDRSNITRDEALRGAYASELDLRITPATLRHFLDAVARAHAGAARMRTPLLMLHGEADTIARPETAFFENYGAPDKTRRVVPGARHNLLLEPEREELCHAIADWILR